MNVRSIGMAIGILSELQIREYLARGYWDETIPLDHVYRYCDATPDREWLVDGTKRLTFAQAVRSFRRLALKFLESDLQPGDFVGRQLPVCADGQLVDLALTAIGAVAMPLSMQARQADWTYIVEATHAGALIIPGCSGDFDYAAMARSLRSSHAGIKQIFVRDHGAVPGMITLEQAFAEDLESKYPNGYLERFRPKAGQLRQIMSSSGTTGTPKLTRASYYPSMFIYRTLAQRFRMGTRDVVLVISPGGPGGVVALPALISGAKLVFLEKFDAEAALQWADREKATIIAGTATQYIKMAEVPEVEHRFDLSHLRLATNAAASLPPDVAQRIERRLGVRVMNIYGTTDAGVPASTCLDDPAELAIRTAGRALPGVEIRVVGEDGSALRPGHAGEIIWRGPCMYGGYHASPALNETKYREGWYFSGDTGILDEWGYLTISGRKDYTINRGGQKISPAEIEEALYLHPAVKEVVVVPMPDRVLGQKACAYAVLRPGAALTFAEAVAFLKARGLSVYKLPERLEIVPELPVSGWIPRVMRANLIADITAKLKSEEASGNAI